jgi:hypothetical protein
LDQFTCPQPLEWATLLKAYGGFSTNETIQTVIEVKRCPDLLCVPDIDERLKTIDVEVIFSNANFNPKDLQNSVTYFMDTSLYT